MNELAGSVWRMTDVRAHDQAGHEQPSPMAPQTMGIVSFEAERMMAAIGDARAPAPRGEPARQYAAYTGGYSFDGAQIVVEVDGASNPALMCRQVRQVRFEGATRMILSPPPRADGLIIEIGWERLD
jgi:hypothetical protein